MVGWGWAGWGWVGVWVRAMAGWGWAAAARGEVGIAMVGSEGGLGRVAKGQAAAEKLCVYTHRNRQGQDCTVMDKAGTLFTGVCAQEQSIPTPSA